jgi:hypothetical protein
MSIGPYAIDSPKYGWGRGLQGLSRCELFGEALPKTLPGVPRRGTGVPRAVHCGAVHFSGLLVSNQLGIPLPAGDPSRPNTDFPFPG